MERGSIQPRTALLTQVGRFQDYNIGSDETITLERLGLAGFEMLADRAGGALALASLALISPIRSMVIQ